MKIIFFRYQSQIWIKVCLDKFRRVAEDKLRPHENYKSFLFLGDEKIFYVCFS